MEATAIVTMIEVASFVARGDRQVVTTRAQKKRADEPRAFDTARGAKAQLRSVLSGRRGASVLARGAAFWPL